MLNLGVEGMMLIGAVSAFMWRRRPPEARRGRRRRGMLGRRALSLAFAVLTLVLMANQVATGLALSLFGIGLSAFGGLNHASVASHRWLSLPVSATRPLRHNCLLLDPLV